MAPREGIRRLTRARPTGRSSRRPPEDLDDGGCGASLAGGMFRASAISRRGPRTRAGDQEGETSWSRAQHLPRRSACRVCSRIRQRAITPSCRTTWSALASTTSLRTSASCGSVLRTYRLELSGFHRMYSEPLAPPTSIAMAPFLERSSSGFRIGRCSSGSHFASQPVTHRTAPRPFDSTRPPSRAADEAAATWRKLCVRRGFVM